MPPKPCFSARRRNRNDHRAKIRIKGSNQLSRLLIKPPWRVPLKVTCDCARASASSGSTRTVTNWLRLLIGSLSLPLICCCSMRRSLSFSSLSRRMNSL
ncbi:hypothetical protein D3C72_1687100 [compost metagenome]